MSTPDELKAQLEELTKSLAEAQEALAPIEAAKAELSGAEAAAYQAYQVEVAKIREQKAVFDTQAFEFQSKVNQAQAETRRLRYALEEAERQAALEEARLARQAELDELNKLWEVKTLGAPWREWAKDHQISGGKKITADRSVILADPMGLGKTLTSIIACDMAEAATREASKEWPFLGEAKESYDYEQQTYVTKVVGGITRPVGKRILYFCPASMIRNVEKEFRMWAGHRNVTFIGGMPKASRQWAFDNVLKNRADYVVICNYEAWRKDLSLIDSLLTLDFDTIIIDEAHNIKDTKSVGYRGIKRLIDEGQPEYVIPMTGTPILNRPQELFSLLTLVAPNQFYHLNDFLWDFCEQDNNTKFWKFKPGGLDRIAAKISKNFLRRTKDQAGIDLPEKTVTEHLIEVDEDTYPGQARVRKQMKQYATIMVDESKGKAIAAAAIIAVFTRLRQVETWPAGIKVEKKEKQDGKWVVVDTTQVDVEESQKIDYVIRQGENGDWDGLIPEVIEDERVVLFSQFKAPLKELRSRIEAMGKRAVILDGDTPDNVRQEIMVDFDNRYTADRSQAKWDIVLCNYRVGGVGMNLTAATQMIILDEEWNPGKRDQAYDRIHRIGQDKPVTIHVIRNKGTIDDWLAAIMESKEGLVEGFNNAVIDSDMLKKFLDGDSGLL